MPINVQQLRTECVYRAEAPLSVICGDMDTIANVVAAWRAYRTKVRWLSVGLLVLGLLCLFFEAIWVGLVAVAASIAGFVYAFRYARGAITHIQRCQTVKALTRTLADDSHPKAPIKVDLSLRDGRKLLKQAKWDRRKNGKESYYLDGWLTFDAKMLDGTTFSESVTDFIRVRSYTNPRGKSKTKTRTRHILGLRLVYPSSVYGDVRQSGARLKNPFKLPPSAHVKAVAVTEHDIKVKARVDQTNDLVTSAAALALGSYRMLNFGRRVAAQQGGAR